MVAVLDVMGFKNLLAPTSDNISKLNKYFNLIEAFRAFGFSHPQTYQNFPIDLMAVSDGIVISVTIENEWSIDKLLNVTAEFFRHVTTLQGSLALTGIWSRGAVTIGDLFLNVDKSILVGQAFVNAYSLERDANYPRVIIDPKVLKFFSMSGPKFCKTLQNLGAPIQNFYPSQTIDYGPDDFMQLDWFGNSLGDSIKIDQEHEKWNISKRSKFELFFKDLKERQNDGADVFLKTQRLIAYIQRSFSENTEKYGKQRSADNIFIFNELLELTGIEPFKWS